MPGKSRHNRDDVIVEMIARGETQTAAAKLAGCSATTVARRLADESFRSRISSFRKEMLDSATGKLSSLLDKAVLTLGKLLDGDNPPGIRLSAAKAVAELTFKARDLLDLETRFAELEARIGSNEKEERHGF